MTSNPGDEKVIQDDVHFKGSTDHKEINTTRHADTLAEVQRIIDEVGEDGGVKITLPSGILEPSSDDLPVVPKRNTIIEGEGRESTIIDTTDIGEPVFYSDNSGNNSGDTRAEHLVFRDFSITSNNISGSAGIYLSSIRHATIEDCWIYGVNNGIILEDGSFFGNIRNAIVRNCRGPGIEIREGSDGWIANATKIYGGGCISNDTGIKIDSGAGITVDTYLDYNDQNAILGSVSSLEFRGGIEGESGIQVGTSTDTAKAVTISSHFNLDDPNADGSVGAIDVVDVDGLTVEGTRIRSVSGNPYCVQLSGNADNVTVGNDNSFETSTWITGSVSYSHQLNDGVWSLRVFSDMAEMGTLADTLSWSATAGRALTVRLPTGSIISGDSNLIDGLLFPYGTHFKGYGNAETVLDTTSGNVARLYKGQKLSNVRIRAANHGVRLQDPEATLENVYIEEAGGDGVVFVGNNCLCYDVSCNSANITGTDINMGSSDGGRVVACNGTIDASSATNTGLAANIDTL